MMHKFSWLIVGMMFCASLFAQGLDRFGIEDLPLGTPKELYTNPDISKVAPEKCVKPKGKFPWHFEKGKLTDMVDQISQMTCKNFIISSDVRPNQEVSIISRTPITVNQAWRAFQSTLESNDLTLVQIGAFNKIVKRAASTRLPIPVIDKQSLLPDDEGMVTFLYELNHVGKDVAQSLVKGMISRVGDVLVIGDNFLVITDGASNIRRVMSILGKIDISGADNQIKIVSLVHAEATAVKSKLDDIFSSSQGGSKSKSRRPSPYDDFGPFAPGGDTENFSLHKMIADERTNKLIVIASDKAFIKIKEMIDVLDVPASGASSQGYVYVYYLKHGDAKKMASTLSSVMQGLKSNRPKGNATGGDALFQGDIKVSADEATNSLVVVASPRDYKALIKVIAKLDRKRAQVYVEAAIMEITSTDTNNFNFSAFGGIPMMIGGGQGVGILSNPGGKTLATSIFENLGKASATGSSGIAAAGLAPFLNTIGFMGPEQTFTMNGQQIKVPGIGAVLEMIQQYSNVDVLSTPSIMTMDNETAEMSVGSRVPTLGSTTTGGAGLIPVQTVKYEEPKLKFKITPHVNDNNEVRMEIEQDISELGEQVALAGVGLQYQFQTKSAKTTVMAKDQQTIVLGGLISESYQKTEEKIPWLGDIPWLGHLFKKTKKIKIKKNLLLVLTPYIIRDASDLKRIYERKVREREEFSKLYFGDKITQFDPYVDYDKKQGPIGHLIEEVEHEMMRRENGGPGLPGEIFITPSEHDDLEKHKVQTLSVSLPAPLSTTTVADSGPKYLEPTEIRVSEKASEEPNYMPLPPPLPADLMPVGELGRL